MVYCNTTLTDEKIDEVALWKNGLTFHHLGTVLCAVFGLVSIVISFFLIFQHATHYSRPTEQKHIIRILLMIPIYSVSAFLSYLFYQKAIYFETIGDCYEAIAIAAFFTLLCHYIAPDLHAQKDYFRQLHPINWFWGVFGLQKCTGGQDKGILRKPRSGLTWFNVVWVGVFQYCFVRVFFTIVAVVSEVFGRYCEISDNPAFAHIWVLIFEGASVTVAMFCLVQFYLQLRQDLASHRPFLKVLSIKLVIFFSFWQTLVISFLSSSGALKTTKTLAYPDIRVGLPNLLLCIEMAIFSVMHLFAFPWREYHLAVLSDPHSTPEHPQKYHGGRLGSRAMLDALNPWDIIKAFARGTRWLFVGRRTRHQDISYKGTAPDPASITSQPPFASSPPPYAATELRPSTDDRLGRAAAHDPHSDTAGLLQHAAGTSPARQPSLAPDHGAYADADVDADLGYLHSGASSGGASYGGAYGHGGLGGPAGYGDALYADTGYHGAPAAQQHQVGDVGFGGAGAGAGVGVSSAAAYAGHAEYAPQSSSEEWDHWAGAHRTSGDGGAGGGRI